MFWLLHIVNTNFQPSIICKDSYTSYFCCFFALIRVRALVLYFTDCKRWIPLTKIRGILFTVFIFCSLYFIDLRPYIFIDPKCRLFIFSYMVLAMWITTGLLCQFVVLNLSVNGYVLKSVLGYNFEHNKQLALALAGFIAHYTVLTSPNKDETVHGQINFNVVLHPFILFCLHFTHCP